MPNFGKPLIPKPLALAPIYLFSAIVDQSISPDYRGGPITSRQYMALNHREQMIVDQYCARLERSRKLDKK